jgi:DNA adenine methylase
MKPILRWVGGKTRIIDDVFRKFPKTIHNYHEIFLGGGSVLFAFLERVAKGTLEAKGKIYAYDFNKPLIYVFINLQNDHSTCSRSLISLCNKFNKSRDKEKFYYDIRSKYNKLINSNKEHLMETTVLFIFLNKTCYGGLYRVGPSGFNVSFSFCDHIDVSDIKDHFHKASILIKKVRFRVASFETSLKKITNKDDFVYLDPPYLPISATSFVSYTSDGFPYEKHMQLFDLIKKLPCKFLMSNSNVPQIYKSFPKNRFNIQSIDCRRSIVSSVVKEVLVSPKKT